ncbi:MAG: hydrogenase iron-sulfur subunit [Candidatus Bathyarchaeia archaeon]
MLAENSVRIRNEYCSKCLICSSICPFEAISIDKETGEILLNIEKCQVCGICFSACPSSSIDIAYYKTDILSEYIRRARKDNLILVCRGAVIRPELRERLEKQGVLNNFIQWYVPCIGRIPLELLLRALEGGVKRIVIVPCEDNKCRFKFGSNVGLSRLLLLQELLSQIGLNHGVLSFARSSIRAYINRNRCIGCGNCAYICPSNAARLVSPGVAEIDGAACSGCGACTAVCPSLAINLESFENKVILEEISRHRQLISDLRAKGLPAVAVFYCHWASFPALDEYGAYAKENVVFFEVPCSSIINPLYILRAFYEGFDGVLVMACRKSECKFERGNELAERQVNAIKNLLRQVGLEGRLEICFVSPKYLGEAEHQIKLFMDKVAAMVGVSK